MALTVLISMNALDHFITAMATPAVQTLMAVFHANAWPGSRVTEWCATILTNVRVHLVQSSRHVSIRWAATSVCRVYLVMKVMAQRVQISTNAQDQPITVTRMQSVQTQRDHLIVSVAVVTMGMVLSVWTSMNVLASFLAMQTQFAPIFPALSTAHVDQVFRVMVSSTVMTSMSVQTPPPSNAIRTRHV